MIQGYGAGARAPELGILLAPGAGAQVKNQKEPELSLKFRTGAVSYDHLSRVPS